MSKNNNPLIAGKYAETIGPASYSDQVYGKILADIVAGRLAKDGRLPAEMDLCKKFGVSRPVVRKALSRLRLDGLVEARRGSGTYVVSRPSNELKKLTDLTEISKVLRYLELRLLIEGTAAAYAAQRRSSDAMALIVRAHDRFVEQISSGLFLPTGDREFHMAISAATGNEFFTSALESAKTGLSDFMTLSLSLTKAGSPQRARAVMQEHANIVEAIKVQDPVAAKIAMEFHILQAKRRLTDRSYEP